MTPYLNATHTSRPRRLDSEPTAIRIGRLIAIAGRSAPGFDVSATNSLRAVSLEQIVRAFTLGAPGGDLAYWSQLGLNGDWMWHAIHLYGPGDDGHAFTALRFSIMGGRPLNPRYESLPDDDAIATALAGDHRRAQPHNRICPAPAFRNWGRTRKAGIIPLKEDRS